LLVRLDDPLIHVARETEIVGIHHELFLGAQNTASLIRRNFFGLARRSFRN
jgi:hypothetical protein